MSKNIGSRPNESEFARAKRLLRDRERKRQRRAQVPPDTRSIERASEFTDNEMFQCFYSEVGDVIGKGGFGSVRACGVTSAGGTQSQVALKTVKWISPSDPDPFGATFAEVRLEAEVLRDLNKNGSHPHVPQLLWQHASFLHQTFSMVMLPFFIGADSWSEDARLSSFTATQTQAYMLALVSALKFVTVHEAGIVHLDIKPQNFLYSRGRSQYLLVDFGLACKAELLTTSSMARDYSDRPGLGAIGTRHGGWRAPEVMLEFSVRVCASDLWAAGLLFLAILLRCESVLQWKDDWGKVVDICGRKNVDTAAAVLGRGQQLDDLCRQVQQLGQDSNGKFQDMDGKSNIVSLREWLAVAVPDGSEPLWGIPDEGLFMMMSLLDPNPVTRLSSSAAVDHNYFKLKRNTTKNH